MGDEVLYRHYRGGDLGAFEALYQRYRKSLYGYLLRMVPEDAEDLYQDTWSRLIHAKQGFQEGSLRAYLFQIARNLIIDRHRRARLQLVDDEEALGRSEDARPGPDTQVHDADCHRRLLDEIGALPHEQREAFLFKEEGGLSLEQIAGLLSVGRETIKSRLRYALKRLRTALEDCL